MLTIKQPRHKLLLRFIFTVVILELGQREVTLRLLVLGADLDIAFVGQVNQERDNVLADVDASINQSYLETIQSGWRFVLYYWRYLVALLAALDDSDDEVSCASQHHQNHADDP